MNTLIYTAKSEKEERDKRMLVSELKNKWENAQDQYEQEDLLREIKVSTYLPYSKKVRLVDSLVEATVIESDYGILTYHSMERWFNFVMVAIISYTNLEFTSTEDKNGKTVESYYEDMDFLIQNGIWEMIHDNAGQDMEDFLAYFNQAMDDVMRENNLNSIVAKALTNVTNVLTDAIKNIDKDAIGEVLGQFSGLITETSKVKS